MLITSGKGGVGKTTLVSNLASALTKLGQNVIAVDANLTTPNLSLHLGLHLVPNTLHDVLRGDAPLKNSIYPHPLGFKVIPGSMNVNDLIGVDPSKISSVLLNLLGKSDFILTDCAAGLGREAITAIQATDEVILITNPDLPSVVDGLKAIKLAEANDKKIIGVVVNRVGRKKHELNRIKIEEILNYPVLVEIPEDRNVSKAIAQKLPVVDYAPSSPASVAVQLLAHKLVGEEFLFRVPRRFLFLEKLINWLVR